MEIPTNIIVNNCKWIDRYSPQIPETRHPVRSMLLLLSCSMHVSRLTASPELNCYSLRQSVSNCRSFVFFQPQVLPLVLFKNLCKISPILL